MTLLRGEGPITWKSPSFLDDITNGIQKGRKIPDGPRLGFFIPGRRLNGGLI